MRSAAVAKHVWVLLLLLPGCLLLGVPWAEGWVGLAAWGAAALVLALVGLGVRAGISRWAVVSVIALLLLLGGYLLSAPAGTPFSRTLSDALPRLLTAPVPIPATLPLLAPVLLVVGLVALGVGARMHGPRADSVTPVFGGVLTYLGAALLGSGRTDELGGYALALLVVIVGGWAAMSGPPDRRAAARGVRNSLLLALPLLAMLPFVAGFVSRDQAYEPRKLVTPPVVHLDVPSPLPQLAAWNRTPTTELLRVQGDRYPLRLVTLTEYTGAAWRAGTSYREFGSYQPERLPHGPRQVVLQARIRVRALTGPWLPSPGAAAGVEGTHALVEPISGGLIAADGHTTDVQYDVSGLVDAPEDAVLTSAMPPRRGAERYLKLDNLPQSLAAYAQVAAGDADTPFTRAKAIERSVQGGRELNPKAIGGSSYARIESFLLGKDGTAGAQEGTSEQFATAFVLLARQSGLPSRLVVGFQPGTDLGDGTRSVRGRDAFAWPEVYFENVGWVPFSPTPSVASFKQPDPPETRPDKPRPSISATPEPSGKKGTGPGVVAPEPETSYWPWVAGGVPLLLFLGLALARMLRRARHRRAGAPGAWREVLDAAVLTGIDGEWNRPAPDLGARIDDRIGDRRVEPGARTATEVARRAERSRFAPDIIEDAGLWELARRTSRGLRRQVPWWRRWWWNLSPRPLLRSRRERVSATDSAASKTPAHRP